MEPTTASLRLRPSAYGSRRAAMPQPLLAAHAQELPEPLARVATDPLALADTVAALRRYSLVRVVADGLCVHRLLQAVVRAAEDADTERAWVATAVRFLRAGFPDRSSEVANWPECQRLLPHALVAADHGRRLDVESAGGCGCSTRWLCTCGAEASTGRPWRSTSRPWLAASGYLGITTPTL
jgi:hypothetical protein